MNAIVHYEIIIINKRSGKVANGKAKTLILPFAG